MFEDITRAIAQQDYTTATQLIDCLKQKHPDHPWLIFYAAQVAAAQGNRNSAKNTYQTLLRECSNRKLVLQVREAIRQLETVESDSETSRVTEQQWHQRITQALAQPGGTDPAVFILGALPADKKQPAAQLLAQTFSIDPYNARLQIPSRGWRLFRLGKKGELSCYCKALQKENIPCFYAPLNALNCLNIAQVQYFHVEDHDVTAGYINAEGQEATLEFQWSDIQQQVQGRVPIFEEVMTKDPRGKAIRKTETLDYVQFCDLHLFQKRTILRLCDQQYQFQYSVPLANPIQPRETITRKWAKLLDDLEEQMPAIQRWGNFTSFGESAIAFPQMLNRIPSSIDLKRRYESSWDAAFQLYSGLLFFKGESDLKPL